MISTATADSTPSQPSPDRCDYLATRKSSMGSTYQAYFADPWTVANLARLRLEDAFRRVVLDSARGLILLMAPSHAHESTKELANRAVQEVADVLRLPCAPLGSTRWRGRGDPPGTGPEPDCCFYVGRSALAYWDAEERGEEASNDFVLSRPPELVVEVGVTHVDADKAEVYRRLGVPELWRVDRPQGVEPSVRFVSLQDAGGPQEVGASRILPDIDVALFAEVLRVVRRRRAELNVAGAVEDVLRASGIPSAQVPATEIRPPA